jgi:Flp pilus assembly protein TadD
VSRRLKQLMATLEASPRDWRALMEAGSIHHAHGDDVTAARWMLAAAESLALDELVTEAVAVAKQAAKLDPRNFEIVRFLAECHEKLGLAREAAEWRLKLPYG